MDKITEFIVTRGDMQTVLWLMIGIILSIIYALARDRAVFFLMVSSYITCIASFSKMTLTSQVITFIVLYLCTYLGLKYFKPNSKKE